MVQFAKISLPTSFFVPACDSARNTRITSVAAVRPMPVRERLNSLIADNHCWALTMAWRDHGLVACPDVLLCRIGRCIGG